MSPEEDRTCDTVDSKPKHYQLSYPGPLCVCVCVKIDSEIHRLSYTLPVQKKQQTHDNIPGFFIHMFSRPRAPVLPSASCQTSWYHNLMCRGVTLNNVTWPAFPISLLATPLRSTYTHTCTVLYIVLSMLFPLGTPTMFSSTKVG